MTLVLTLLGYLGDVLSRAGVLLALGVSGVVALASFKWVAGRLRWSQVPTLFVLLSLGGALAITVVGRLGGPGSPEYALELPECLGIGDRTGSDPGVLLNLFLLAPLGLALVLASGRFLLAVIGVVATSLVVEIVQGWFDLGFCEGADLVFNTAGGVAAAMVGFLILEARQGRSWIRWGTR